MDTGPVAPFPRRTEGDGMDSPWEPLLEVLAQVVEGCAHGHRRHARRALERREAYHHGGWVGIPVSVRFETQERSRRKGRTPGVRTRSLLVNLRFQGELRPGRWPVSERGDLGEFLRRCSVEVDGRRKGGVLCRASTVSGSPVALRLQNADLDVFRWYFRLK